MFDHSRLVRLITVALASCVVTWALAAGAFARPDAGATTTDQSSAPAFKAVPGDTNKVPSATTQAPAFRAVAGDTAKTPDPAQVERVLNGIDNNDPGAGRRHDGRHRHDRPDPRDRGDPRRPRRGDADDHAHAPSRRGRVAPEPTSSKLPVTRRAGVARRPPVSG